ncbi:hypothetical protein MNBD_NITROSPINAE03-775 [hydrothermal vent metagenome]|uniref:Uncharacterized protein n=1 Tax=hydrothermal vent metagenome TaxID=652676 RepID=A0A3B1CKA4_9ZZZZ
MRVETDIPFEFEIVAEYLNRGDSIVYLTRHDPERVGRELTRMGMGEETKQRLCLIKTTDAPMEEFGLVISKIRPDRVMADSVSDIFKLRSSLLQKKGHFSCKINERPGK